MNAKYKKVTKLPAGAGSRGRAPGLKIILRRPSLPLESSEVGTSDTYLILVYVLVVQS